MCDASRAPSYAPYFFMTTQFVLRNDKKDGTGRCPVHLIASFDGLRLKGATGEKCKPSEWNEGRQRFRGTITGADEANDFLELRAKQVSEWWRKARAADRMPTTRCGSARCCAAGWATTSGTGANCWTR